MKSKISISFFTFFLLSIVGYGQSPLSKKIDSTLAPIVKPNEPGFSVGVVKKGKFVYTKGFGLADLQTKRNNTTETSFNIASDGKKFTAACIYLLQDQGKLKTSDKLSKYFKDFPKYADSITINHLIHHQSGLRDYISLEALRNFDENSIITEASALNILVNQKALNFKPGSQFSYSNSGYFLLALIVKKVSGMDLIKFSNRYIFRPLKMNSTSFSRTHKIFNKANGYILEKKNFTENAPRTITVGQGNVYSKITDWDKWFIEMKQHNIFGDTVWKNMLEVGKTMDGKAPFYAGGLFVTMKKNKRLISHGGDLSGYHSSTRYFPDENLGIVVFTNNDTISPDDISDKILAEIYPENVIPKKADQNEEYAFIKKIKTDTSAIVGLYKIDKDSSKIFQVTTLGNKIMFFQKWNDTNYEIKPSNDSLFHIDKDTDITFQFKSNINGFADKLEITQGGVLKTATRIPKTIALINFPNDKMSFYSPEINAHYKIIKDNNSLYLIIGPSNHQYKIELIDLKEKNKYLIIGCDMFITFKYVNEKLCGFILDHERVKNIHFAKS